MKVKLTRVKFNLFLIDSLLLYMAVIILLRIIKDSKTYILERILHMDSLTVKMIGVILVICVLSIDNYRLHIKYESKGGSNEKR